MAKSILKAALARLFGDYSYYRILASPTEFPPPDADEASSVVSADVQSLESARSEEIRAQSWYAGPGAQVFAWRQDQEIVAVCAFWHGDRYAERAFWPLKPGEAKLVQIVVDPAFRARGIATRLIEHSSARMRGFGFTRLYARVWHSNAPSLRAFQGARWQRIASVVEIKLLGLGPRLRLRWR
jgi:ribosomal protein S18 acetylase RimI-like enzyme